MLFVVAGNMGSGSYFTELLGTDAVGTDVEESRNHISQNY
jgi:hypothetical protein